MLRPILFVSLCCASLSVRAQVPGKKLSGSVEVSGFRIQEGDTLHFAQGTMPNGDFMYVFQPPNVFAGSPEYHMHRSFSGRYLIVKGLREAKSKRAGIKILAVVNPGGFNSAVELEDAIKAGEISAINSKSVSTKQPVASSLSVADELLKLKQLLDAGAITQNEYDAQKNKLLNP